MKPPPVARPLFEECPVLCFALVSIGAFSSPSIGRIGSWCDCCVPFRSLYGFGFVRSLSFSETGVVHFLGSISVGLGRIR